MDLKGPKRISREGATERTVPCSVKQLEDPATSGKQMIVTHCTSTQSAMNHLSLASRTCKSFFGEVGRVMTATI